MKNKGIYIKLSNDELQKMKSKQKKLGFKNFSEFARKTLLLDLELKNFRVKEKREEKKRETTHATKIQERRLRRLENNINQIARKMNSNDNLNLKRLFEKCVLMFKELKENSQITN